MIIDCAVYRQGRRVEGTPQLEASLSTCEEQGGFVWIGLHEPSEAEFADVAAHLHLHPLAVEDAIHAHQRPKLEHYGNMLFIVLKPARYVDHNEVVKVGQIMMFVGAHFVVTVRHGESGSLGSIRAELEASPETLSRGPLAVLHAVADLVVDEYAPVVAAIAIDVDEIEHAVFSGPLATHAERIFKLKREVLEFRWAVDPLVGPLEDLAGDRSIATDDQLRPYFRDVHDHLLRVTDRLSVLDSLLDAALGANVAQVGMRQNEDMRKISAWVAIIALPTLIAGIYGMNFEQMPELGWVVGYPFALGLMCVCCILLYRNFKRRGWL
ncbi:MAG: magnesium/cobalt transporter CorA [Ilumatobacteraceae bacterium]